MEITVYIVSARTGSEMDRPVLFLNDQDAYKAAREYVYEAASDRYGKSNPSVKTLVKWAEKNGYDFSDNYFWDGCHDAVETMVTEHTIKISL